MKNLFTNLNKPLLFSWILVVLNLSLILKSGLYSDDNPVFQYFRSAGMSFPQMLQYAWEGMVNGIKSGRFTPVTFFLDAFLFWFSHTILIYKLMIFGINLWAVFMFTRFLRAFKMGHWIPFALLLYCATTQFYINFHDAFTSIHAMYPLLAVLIFSSAILFISFLKNGKPLTLACALFVTALTICVCEIGFVIYPILLLLLINDKRRFFHKILAFLPFVALLGVYTAIFIIARRNVEHLYSGVSTDFTVSKMYDTFWFQFRAAIPLTHFTRMYAIPHFLLDQFSKAYPLVVFCFIAFIGLLFYTGKDTYDSISSRKKITILFIALILLILPACFLMVSGKYQQELGYGKGYLPVYIQDFGVVLFMLVLFSFVFPKLGSAGIIFKPVLFILFFAISVCTLLQNNSLIDSANYNGATPSAFYYKSLKNGILKDCEDSSVIIMRSDYFWRSAQSYQMIIDNLYKKRFTILEEENFNGIPPGDGRHYYMLEHNNIGQYTLLYRLSPNEIKEIKRINYPTGKDFSYFDLISTPL